MTMTSRLFPGLRTIAVLSLAVLMSSAAVAAEKRHASSLIGAPKYGPDFKHFDYVNPEAPKGGTLRMSDRGTFDNFNLITYKGNTEGNIGLIYDSLMAGSMDESSTEYGLIAEWLSYPDDYSSVTYKLRDAARWHDGKPITVEDVIFSLNTLKEHNPHYAQYYANVVRAEKTGDREVTFIFSEKGNRELPQIVGQLTILPKHFYEENAQKRDPGKTWLEVPLGSGAYRIKSFEAGKNIVYERVKDYWAANLPVAVGQYNFDEIRYDYYLDIQTAFEAFKKGDVDFYQEMSAISWAKYYDFPAIKDGRVKKRGDVVLQNLVPMQGFAFNTRLPKFADPRVRKALNLAFNFEWMNANLFHDQYRRTSSYFQRSEQVAPSELAATGLPQGKELEILNEIRDQVPPEVFTTEYKNPVNPVDAEGEISRTNRREALELLSAAGWEIKDGVLVNAKTGEPMTVEILVYDPKFEKIALNYLDALKRNLGISGAPRSVDDSQYKARQNTFDYEMILHSVRQTESPGNEQRYYWTSKAADMPGSQNAAGIKNPAVDKLVDRIIFAKDRAELVAACRALDRVLQWNYYVIPQWHSPNERFAYWDMFAQPQTLPTRSIGFPTVWWYDAAKAAKLGR